MTFILRWPAILVLLALVLLCFGGALAATGLVTGVDVGIPQLRDAQEAAAESGAADAGWIDIGLLAGAGLFFLIAAVRLVRRTQGFWLWLLGFACFGGRWAWGQQQEGDLLATVQGVDPNVYLNPESLAADAASTEAQLGVMGVVLIVGLLIFIVDAADRAYWNKQGA